MNHRTAEATCSSLAVLCLSSEEIEDIVLCIAHRGRLNLLTCLLNFPPVEMFRKVTNRLIGCISCLVFADVEIHSFSISFSRDQNNYLSLPNGHLYDTDERPS